MKDLSAVIRSIVPHVVRLRRDLHAHPELGYRERRTARRVVEELRRLPGVEIRKGVAGTGVVAVLGRDKPGPCIALRADMDALPMTEESGRPYASRNPGCMHACGHDGHTACLIGTAMALSRVSDAVAGPVKFVFQPAEETLGGAARMCREGVLENPAVSAIFGMHVHPAVALGRVCASRDVAMAANGSIRITIRGKGTHAARPHAGVDPILIGSHIVAALQSIVSRSTDPVSGAVVSITTFNAGTTANVIPPTASLTGTCRALSEKALKSVGARIIRIAKTTARAFGGRAEVAVTPFYPVVVQHPKARAFFLEVAADAAGAAAVDGELPPSMGSEDFAFYAQRVPALFWFVGNVPPGSRNPVSIHHPAFDFNDAVIPAAVRLQCDLALRFARQWR